MKQNNLFIALLTIMLLLPMGALAQSGHHATIQEGDAIYDCVYRLEGTMIEPIISPVGATIVAYDMEATATHFDVPSSITATITTEGKNPITREVTFVVKGITGRTTNGLDHGAFQGNRKLKSVTIPETVGMIGNKSFYNTKLTTVIFSPTPTLENIGNSAFANCSSLTNITIPASVTNIGASAFEGCTSLNRAELPDGLTTLGRAAFKGCTSLSTYSFGGLTSIPESAYEGCTSISYLGLPYDLTSVGANAFKGCTGLTTVELYATMQNIAPTAFADCNPDNVTYTIKPSDNVTTVANGLMQNCECVGKVVLADGITAVGSDAFNGCNVLCRLELTTSVRSIVSDAFNVTSNFIVDVNSSQGEYKDIANDLFSNVSSLTTVNINSGVTAVGEGAFGRCSDLKNININDDSELSIGVCAFQSCTSLKEISFPKNVSSIGQGAFQFCPALENIGLFITTSVKPNSFAAAGGDEALPTLTIYPEGNNFSVPDSYYDNLLGISKVVVSEGIASIGKLSFYGMPSLEAVELPTTLTSIGDYAFQACSNLINLTMYTTTTSIGEGTFSGCGSLSVSIDAHETNTTIADNLFENCQKMVSLTTNGITAIGENAFIGCTSLSTVSLPNGLTTIGLSSFSGCTSLTQVDIPESVTSLGAQAFFNCSNLTNVTVKWYAPLDNVSTQSDPFPADKSRITLHVPSGRMSAYQSNAYWRQFFIPIAFADAKVKAICVAQETGWDTNHDGELSEDEAAAVTTLGMAFTNNTEIETFEELKYFTGLKHGTLPALIGGDDTHGAFDGCTNLKYVELPPNIEQIMNFSFRGCTSLFTVDIPASVSDILDYAFADCSQLGFYRFTLPESLDAIHANTFSGCSYLYSIIIPAGVSEFHDQAFSDCDRLKEVIVLSSTPGTIDGDPFPSRANIKLIVPPHTSGIYESTDYWKDFQIEEADPEWLIYTDADGNQYQYDPGYRARLYKIASQATDVVILDAIPVDGSTLPVTSIAYEGAYSNYMEQLTIPASITELKPRSLFGPNLKAIHMLATTPPAANDALSKWEDEIAAYNYQMMHEHPDDYVSYYKSLKDVKLYVPVVSKDEYEYDTTWKKFTVVEEPLKSGRALADVQLTYNIVMSPLGDYTGVDVELTGDATNAMCTAFQMGADELWNNVRCYASTQPNSTIMNYAANAEGPLKNESSFPNSSGDFGHWFDADGNVVIWGDNAVVYTYFTRASKKAHVGKYPEHNINGDTRTVREAIVLKDATGEEATVCITFNITFNSNAEPSSTLTNIEYNWHRGNANGDEIIDINDVLAIVDYILGNAPANFDVMAADANGDGAISIADATAVLNIILSGNQ